MAGPLDLHPVPTDPAAKLAADLAALKTRVTNLERSNATSTAYYAEQTAEVSTSSFSAVDLGGPSVTFTVTPVSAFVAVFADVELYTAMGNYSQVFLNCELGDKQIIVTGDASYTRVSTGGSISNFGAYPPLGNFLVHRINQGTYTYRLDYASQGGGACFFRNRRLWVQIQPG